jgi:hypothetical protein
MSELMQLAALIVAMIAQTLVIIGFLLRIESRLTRGETEVTNIKERVADLESFRREHRKELLEHLKIRGAR